MIHLIFFLCLGNLFFSTVVSVVVQTEQGRLRGEYLETVTGDAKYVSYKGIPYAKPPIGDLRFMSTVVSVVVQTEQGRLRGEYLKTVTGDAKYVSFKGIPYAKPPVGDLRFMAPQLPESWNGVRNATEHGSICIQLDVYNNDITGSEDCLYLNVYTPNVKPEKSYPVMLFIHGGGLKSGSGNVDRYGPDYLIAQNVVIVTFNYRLGALGFLCLNTTDVPGNMGLKDQVAAMRWVQKNIANFGGNQSDVSIFGQSAGGSSVALHNLSPMTKGLYNRSIAMSGGPFNDWFLSFEPRRRAFRLGQLLGIWTDDDQELLTFFKALPAEQFLDIDTALLRSETPSFYLKQFFFTPVVETDYGAEHFLTTDPLQALKYGNIHDVDLMIGHTTIEALINLVLEETIVEYFSNYTEMMVPTKILEDIPPVKMFSLAEKIHTKYFGDKPINSSVVKELVNYMSETYYNYGINKYATLFSKYRNTYMYKFTKVTNFTRHLNLDNKYGINGATHEDDLLYLFYPHDGNVTLDKNSEDYKLVNKITTMYANFAKYGNPTPDTSLDVEWPKYNNDTEYYLDIDTNLTVGQHLDADVASFWDSIYLSAQVEL